MLKKNQIAPHFVCPDQNGSLVDLNTFKSQQNVVLYFYPKDDTPGCTIEANQFTQLIQDFARYNTVILGVSKDDALSHKQFINKFNLKITLLSDIEGKLCDAYGVWQEKEKNGIKKMGIVRSTFIINKQGVLEDVDYQVTADGHAQHILERIKRIEQ